MGACFCRHFTPGLVLGAELDVGEGAGPSPGPVAPPVQCGQDYAGQKIGGWYASEKFDGVRGIWDGATLRTRAGNVLTPPDWWSAHLPAVPLDGELWAGYGSFQRVSGIVLSAMGDWSGVHYMVFDAPVCARTLHFGDVARYMRAVVPPDDPVVVAVEQHALYVEDDVAWEQAQGLLDSVVARGGEGIMVRDPSVPWTPGRVPTLLKIKPVRDGEGTVIGWNPGKGRLAGRLGTLRVQFGEVQFNLSGFTDEERELSGCGPMHFIQGQAVRFKFRKLSDNGVPIEARYWRSPT